MKLFKLFTALLFITSSYTINAQNGYSVANAIPVEFTSSNTVTFSNVNSSNSTGDTQGTLGGCSGACCLTLVYKVTIPQEGALSVELDNPTALANFLFAYTGTANASSNADLTFYKNGITQFEGNQCLFRDTLYIGRGYNRYGMQAGGVSSPYWKDKATWNTANGEFSMPAGTYYIHVANYNQQEGLGATSNLTFEFAPYCVDNQPEIEVEGNSVGISDGDNTPSTNDNTDFGTMLSGAAAVSKTFTIKNVSANQLDVFSTTITGDNAANFSVTASPSATVAGSSSTTFTVEFTPNTAGINNATVAISNTDCDKALFNFDLKALVLGVAPNDKRGNMLDLDGSNDYVEINSVASSIDGATEFTLEAWINADATQTNNDRIISINTSGGGNEFLFYLKSGKLTTYDGSDEDVYGSDLRGTGWHHVAVAHDNSRDYVYLDGALLGDGAASVGAFNATHQWSIGQEFDGSSTGDFFKGKFDEVRIWKDVRTQEEIQTNMNLNFTQAQLANLSNLVAYYQFDNDDAVGTTNGVKDVLGNHGTVKNGGTYSASEVAVGNGISEKQTVNATGTYTFSTVGVELTFSGATLPNGDIVISKITTEAPKNVSAGELANKPTTYWVIRNLGANNSGLNVDIKFKFDDGQIDDNLTANHKIHKRGSNQFDSGDWSDLAPSSVGATAGNNHITVNVTSFSQFGASSSTSDFTSVLPVELVTFNGYATTKGSRLTWQTASEKNNEGFEIQRSFNGRDWKNIGFVLGKGTTQESQTYQFVDQQPKDGINYYRLKQIDFDGRSDYSNIVNVEYQTTQSKLQIYPNPVKDELNIIGGQGQATIYNMLGQPIQSFHIENYSHNGSENNSVFKVNTSELTKGQYILQIITQDGNLITKSFLK